MKSSAFESKPFLLGQARRPVPLQIEITLLNCFICRTFHVLNSMYLVWLTERLASETGLTLMFDFLCAAVVFCPLGNYRNVHLFVKTASSC